MAIVNSTCCSDDAYTLTGKAEEDIKAVLIFLEEHKIHEKSNFAKIMFREENLITTKYVKRMGAYEIQATFIEDTATGVKFLTNAWIRVE